MRISIIIPIVNEADLITQTLTTLQPLRAKGHEVIVVDGGSEDSSLTKSQPLADRVIRSPQGRSRQMNAGAQIARGEILLFLHADTFLPQGADQLIISKMKEKRRIWGHFDVHLSGRHSLLRLIEYLMNWRSRLSGIATGDQGIFVRRQAFQSIGGFPEIDLMEDIALSRALKKCGHPLCLWQKVLTSSRRWENNGILRTVFLMWYLRLAYFMGANPRYLARLYRRLKAS
ncbi:MAG TPA: TIGR04283 family arsenosugar biosynthesis glycosyltransferase [Thermodesulfobacteriota bacterium]|nr:TIGR04283 family arsenosugar biosynthesis glycosyltransferase [Thermodesulfobacteriota bacterium]